MHTTYSTDSRHYPAIHKKAVHLLQTSHVADSSIYPPTVRKVRSVPFSVTLSGSFNGVLSSTYKEISTY